MLKCRSRIAYYDNILDQVKVLVSCAKTTQIVRNTSTHVNLIEIMWRLEENIKISSKTEIKIETIRVLENIYKTRTKRLS